MKTVRLAACLFFMAFTASAQYTLGDCTVTVVDDSGAPIAGAEVHCVSWNYGPRTTPLQPDEKSVTDTQGRVTFHNKFIGQSFVRVMHDKLGGWFRIHENDAQGSHGRVTPGLGRTMKGTLRDEAGKPIAGALVFMDGCLPVCETDKDGSFDLPNMGIGNPHSVGFYKKGYEWKTESLFEVTGPLDVRLRKGFDVDVLVLGPDDKPVADAYTFVDGQNAEKHTGNDGKFTIIGVPANEKIRFSAGSSIENKGYRAEQTITLSERPAEPVVLRLEYVPPSPKPVLRGRVIRADDGRPVTAQMLSSQEQYTPTGNPGATGQDGSFVIDNYYGGVYWISARPINPVLYVKGGPVRIDFGNLPAEELVLKVEEGCCIRGVAKTEDGVPISEKWVQIHPWAGFVTMTQTRKDGRFSFANLDGVGVTYTISLQDDFGRQSSVSVGPMKKGEVREGVELIVPAMAKPHKLRVLVRDPNGEPLPNVKLNFSYEGKRMSIPSLPVTDDAGKLEINVVESGKIKVSAWTRTNEGVGERAQNVQHFLKILQNESFDIDASQDSEIELVMEHQPRSVLAGRVVDGAGNGINAQISLIQGEELKEGTTSLSRDGSFLVQRAPAPPYLVEVSTIGYRPRVLVIDEAAQASGDPLTITLKPGPFSVGESVWSTVTGKPATEEAVEATPFASYIRKNEARYYNDAKLPRAPDTPRQPSPPFYTPRVRFVDAHGKPVTQISVQMVSYYPIPPASRYVQQVRGVPEAKSMASDDGVYSLAYNGVSMPGYCWVAWADGMGRVSEGLEQSRDPNAIVDVTLRPACTIEFHVRDADGKPAAHIPVCTINEQPEYDNTKFATVGTTDESGTLRFEQVAPGAHAFMVGAFDVDRRLVAFRLADGENKVVEVNLSVDPSSFDILLQAWRSEKDRRGPISVAAKEAIAAMDRARRDALAAYVREEFDVLADLPRDMRGREPELQFLAALINELKDKQAIPILQRAIRADVRGLYADRGPEYTAVGAMTRAVADMLGDDAVDFFTEIAENEKSSPGARLGAIGAFGQIATPKSAAAFKRIRDAWRAKPGMPQAKESYTHAERMIEAVYFYRTGFTWDFSYSVPPSLESLGRFEASVSNDYKTGAVHLSYGYGGAAFSLVRVGDEWLVKQTDWEAMT